MQLEPARPGAYQARRFVQRRRAARRVDARERDEHVGVRGGRGEHVVVRYGRAPREPLVDGEHGARHVALAVVRRDAAELERDAGVAEVAARGAGRGVRFALGGVRVDVNVDRRQRVDVESATHRPVLVWRKKVV